MEVIATGKWSKTAKQWKLILALRRLAGGTSPSALKQSEARRNKRPPSRKNPDRE